MNWLDTVLIAVIMSFDAANVMRKDVLSYRGHDIRRLLITPLIFSFFQIVMPIFGFYIMVFSGINTGIFSKALVFFILAFIGIRTIYTVFRPEKQRKTVRNDLPIATVISQALYTSVDGFVIGIAYAAINRRIVLSSFVFGAVTAAMCCLMLICGKKIIKSYQDKTAFVVGIVSVAVGIKALF